MLFQLMPPNGIGPLQIGMPRNEAAAALESLRQTPAGSASDQFGQHIVRPSGLMISIGCMRNRLEHIELSRPSDASDTVQFRGIDVFALPAREVVERMTALTSMVAHPDEPATFVAPDLLLSFWRQFNADDDPSDELGYFFNSVLLARPGYYDGP